MRKSILAFGLAAVCLAAAKDQGQKAPAAETAPILSGNELLAAIGTAMQNAAAPYYMGTQAELNDAITAGLVEVNPEIVTGEGDQARAAARLTEAGQAELANSGGGDEGAKSATSFEIDDAVPMPAPIRGGRNGNVYPFAALAVGQSFFVPVTETMPKPAKTLASTVSGASKKNYAEDGQPEDRRYFTVRSVDETAQGRGKGARVWRIAAPAPAAG